MLDWTIISINQSRKSLVLEENHGNNYVSSGLEGLIVVTTWSLWEFLVLEQDREIMRKGYNKVKKINK